MYNCAIIDLDSICFSIGQGIKVLDENGQPIKVDNKFVYKEKTEEELEESCDFFMNSILFNCGASKYIAYIKGKGNFRYLINPEYKNNRPKESPKWWKFVKDYLIDNWNAIEVNDIEADDAVNITRLNISDSFIVAIDKDLLGLEGTHFNWRKNEWVTIDKKEAYYNFWNSMITGDSVDNIKGIPGKGTSYCNKLIELNNSVEYSNVIFNEYLKFFGEELGIEEFYKNYKSLKILNKHIDFVIPEPKSVNKITEDKIE